MIIYQQFNLQATLKRCIELFEGRRNMKYLSWDYYGRNKPDSTGAGRLRVATGPRQFPLAPLSYLSDIILKEIKSWTSRMTKALEIGY